MGADSSKQGAIKITLEKYVYYPGEAVRGLINVILNEPIPPCHIQLGFKGVEEVLWHESRGSGKHRHTVTFHNKVIISRSKYVIASWNQPLQPGSFAIPFVFVTPKELRGSFSFTGFRGVFGVVYKLYARLYSQNIKLRDKQSIGVLNDIQMNRIVQGSVTADLIAWCCMNKGRAIIDVKWINDVYSIGNPLQCLLIVDNTNSKAKVKSITAHVYFVLIAVASSGYTRHFPVTVFKSNFQISVEKGEKRDGDKAIPFAFNLEEAASRIDFLNVHTANGNILKCNFYLEFELNLNTYCLCCGDYPKVTHSIFVKPTGHYNTPQVAAPQGWNPQMHQPVEIYYNPGNEAGDKGTTLLMQSHKDNSSVLNQTAV